MKRLRMGWIAALILLSCFFCFGLPADVHAGVQSFGDIKENTVANINFDNEGFEKPNILEEDIPGARYTLAETTAWNYIPMKYVEGWETEVVDSSHEGLPWADSIQICNEGFAGVPPHEGKQYAELNAHYPGVLYQNCDTIPGQKVYWEFYHRGRSQEAYDVMNFMLNEVIIEKAETNILAWKRYYGVYEVPAGQDMTKFAFESVYAQTGDSAGNLLDAIRLFYPSFLEIEKTVETSGEDSNGAYALPGETITYTIEVKNTGEAETSCTVLTDILPDGIAYIDGSVSMLYREEDGSEQEIDPAGLVAYDSLTEMLTIEPGLEITDAVITDEQSKEEIPNDNANGTRSIGKGDSVLITFEAVVTGDRVNFGDKIENQAKVTYNDLGFELYNQNEQGVIEDDYNYSNIASFYLQSYVDIVIEKDLDQAAISNQTFVFQVDYSQTAGDPVTKTFYTALEVETGASWQEINLTGLQPGHYTVTELGSNWKYRIDAEGNRIQEQMLDYGRPSWLILYSNLYENRAWIESSSKTVNILRAAL